MKRLDLIVLMICIQLGLVLVTGVEIIPGVNISIGGLNLIYLGGLDFTPQITTIYNSINTIANGTWTATQPFQICLLGACTPAIDLPAASILSLALSILSIPFQLLAIAFFILLYAVVLPSVFYASFIIAIMPYGGEAGVALAMAFGGALGIIQTIILVIEIVKLIGPGGGGK
jgi:hypothetical protein